MKVQETILDATQSINRLRDDVQSITDWVSSGSFRKQLLTRTGQAGKQHQQQQPEEKGKRLGREHLALGFGALVLGCIGWRCRT